MLPLRNGFFSGGQPETDQVKCQTQQHDAHAGGQQILIRAPQKRAALIRTLIADPELLLLDEPFSALDYQTRLSVGDDVYKIIKNERKTAVLVTHDISEAISMSDIIVVLTRRPAMVKTIIKPNVFGDTPLKKRESTEFGIMFEKIWKELNE